MTEDIPETIRVAFYVRVSTKDQVDGYGFDLQQEALESLVKMKQGDFKGKGKMVFAGKDYIYADDISGETPIEDRPAFSRLMEDVRRNPNNKPFDLIAVYKIDRFARKLKVLLEVIDFFEENKIGFISVHESIDTSTPFGRAMLGVIGVIAELERENIKLRTSAGLSSAFQDNVVLGISAPYGYTKDINKRHIKLEEEAKIVEQIFYMFVEEKKSLDAIAKYLTAHEVFSPEISSLRHAKRKGSSKKKQPITFWRAERIGHFLRDPIYTGCYYSNKTKKGKKVPRDQWILAPLLVPIIIDKLTFEKAQILLALNQHTKREAKDGHIYILRNLLKCDCCYDPEMHKRGRHVWHGDRKVKKEGILYYYRCGNKNASKTSKVCRALPINANEIENYIVDFCEKLLTSPIAVFNHQLELRRKRDNRKKLTEKELLNLSKIKEIPNRKTNLLKQHELGIISTKDLKEALKDLDEKLKFYEKEYEIIVKEKAEANISANYLKTLELFSKHYLDELSKKILDREKLSEILHNLIEEIVVYGRDVNDEDVIAGKKTQDQKIPNRINIKLKLHQDIMSELRVNRHFGWAIQDSNL